MNIAVVGLSHRTAPVEVREKLSISDDHIRDSFDSLKANEQVIEVSILSTCSRNASMGRRKPLWHCLIALNFSS